MAKILLAGFDRKTGFEFEQKLAHFGHTVNFDSFESRSSEPSEADLVFVCGDDVRWPRYLNQLQSAFVRRPVVVASRMADESHWIAALEAGASDYCALNIADEHLRWIIDSATKRGMYTSVAA